ncbi:MAG: C1 family peptidase [Bdellovibrio sp.]
MFELSTTLTAIFLLLAPHSGFAQHSCNDMFPKEATQESGESKPSYGSLKKDFVLDSTYKVEVPDQSDIKNQCNLGTCHLHSWVSMLEHDFNANTHGDLKISTHYLSVSHWLHRSIEALYGPMDDVSIQLGANVFGSRQAILTYGIIPDEAWTGPRDFQAAPLSPRITEYIKNIEAQAKWEISSQTDQTKMIKIVEKAQQKILDIFENVVGKIPTKFQFRGKEYTPQSFQQEFFPELMKPITQIQISAERKAKTTLELSGSYYTVISANIDVVENTVRNLLDHGQNVYISYDHNAQFVDSKTGIMSISAFDLPPGAGPVSREQRAYFKMPTGGHAVQIVGYDFDPKTNKVIKWKMKNSWGEKSGDHGYYHMFNDYFRAFVSGVSYFSNPEFTPQITEKNPVQMQIPF